MKISISLIFFLLFSCKPNTKEEKYFKAIEANDIALDSSKEGEWLYEHKEIQNISENYLGILGMIIRRD